MWKTFTSMLKRIDPGFPQWCGKDGEYPNPQLAAEDVCSPLQRDREMTIAFGETTRAPQGS